MISDFCMLCFWCTFLYGRNEQKHACLRTHVTQPLPRPSHLLPYSPCSCSSSCKASTPLLPEGPAPSSDTDSPSRSKEDTELERLEGPVKVHPRLLTSRLTRDRTVTPLLTQSNFFTHQIRCSGSDAGNKIVFIVYINIKKRKKHLISFIILKNIPAQLFIAFILQLSFYKKAPPTVSQWKMSPSAGCLRNTHLLKFLPGCRYTVRIAGFCQVCHAAWHRLLGPPPDLHQPFACSAPRQGKGSAVKPGIRNSFIEGTSLLHSIYTGV